MCSFQYKSWAPFSRLKHPMIFIIVRKEATKQSRIQAAAKHGRAEFVPSHTMRLFRLQLAMTARDLPQE